MGPLWGSYGSHRQATSRGGAKSKKPRVAGLRASRRAGQTLRTLTVWRLRGPFTE